MPHIKSERGSDARHLIEVDLLRAQAAYVECSRCQVHPQQVAMLVGEMLDKVSHSAELLLDRDAAVLCPGDPHATRAQ